MASRAADRALVKLLATLDEAQKRWFVGREAMLLGHGGVKRICELSGLSKPTVLRGIRELKAKRSPYGSQDGFARRAADANPSSIRIPRRSPCCSRSWRRAPPVTQCRC
jgi:hypothetical protein